MDNRSDQENDVFSIESKVGVTKHKRLKKLKNSSWFKSEGKRVSLPNFDINDMISPPPNLIEVLKEMIKELKESAPERLAPSLFEDRPSYIRFNPYSPY